MVFLQRGDGVLSQKNPADPLRKVFNNTQYMTFEVTPLKLDKILENRLSILALKLCLVKKLASELFDDIREQPKHNLVHPIH